MQNCLTTSTVVKNLHANKFDMPSSKHQVSRTRVLGLLGTSNSKKKKKIKIMF